MQTRIILLLFVMVTGAGWFFDSPDGRGQDIGSSIRNNKCVNCHSRLTGPAEMKARYVEWSLSAHQKNGVGCDQCHGGDPTRNLKNAHSGMLPSQDPNSRLHKGNLPETCGRCHGAVVSSFVESTHYVKLKETGLGPSCITCHGHMALKVARDPIRGAAFCSFCHDTLNGLQPRRPDIPEKARVTLESINRANLTAARISDLLSEASKKGIAANEEREDLRLLQITLKEAKTGWHAFSLDGPRTKADRAFEEGVRIKDQLAKKLGHD
jgi:hypothetical protein